MEVDDNSVLIVVQSTGDLRPAAQASLNPLIKYYYNYYYINYLSNYILLNYNIKLTNIPSEGGNRNPTEQCALKNVNIY
jgi:hypothetical protein